MVQTYGVARPNSPPNIVVDEDGDESSALLGPDRHVPLKPVTYKEEGHAGMTSSISNLSKTIIGSGMLTFPLAMASAGIIPGMITSLFCGCVAGFGLYLLTLCATKTPHRRSSFFAVSQITYPRAAVFFDAAVAIKCFGVSISYLIIIKDLTPSVVASLYHNLTSPDTNPPQWALSGSNWLFIFMVVLVPLCFLRRLHSLRHTSYIALFSVAYLVLVVVRCYFWPLEDMPSRGEIHFFHLTPEFVSTFPVQVFAFTCSQNVFPLYNEVTNNTQTRMNMIIGGSIGGAIVVYEIIALFGYLTFGSTVGANIIAMYPSSSLFIAVGQLAIVSLVLFSYPLQVHPCRNCLDKVFHFGDTQSFKRVPVDEQECEDEGTLDEDHASKDMSSLKHVVLTVAILALGFFIAFTVDDLKMVLSLVGSTGSTTISFILPGLFYWKLFQDDPATRTMRLGAFGLFIYGVFIFVFCLGFNVYQIVQGGG